MTSKIKILFVDDEARILAGLRRSLYHKSNEWEMSFANSGSEALELLRNEKFDAIITDMRMPLMDGAELLLHVQALYPHIIRMVLSGQTEIEKAMKTVTVAHQFLTKPCTPADLEKIVNRLSKVTNLLKNDQLKSIVCKIGKLPSLPHHYQNLVNILKQHDATTEQITELVCKDIGISTKLLQLVNSAFFGVSHDTTNIEQAVNYIGIDALKELTLQLGIFNPLLNDQTATITRLEQIYKRSIICANIAKNLFEDRQKSNNAFIAGLLHDIGSVILITVDTAVSKEATVGATSAEVGGYLLGIWGIPSVIVDAVIYHQDPSNVSPENVDIANSIYIAKHLAENEDLNTLDKDLLKGINVHQLTAKWQDIAQAVKQQYLGA